MSAIDVDAELLDAAEALASAASEGPWETGGDGLVWAPRIGDPVSGSVELADAEFIAAARTIVPTLVAEIRAYQPATKGRYQLHIHGCGHVEWWHEATQGPINEQGCDACESAPYPGGWQPVYVRKAARP